VRAAGVGVRSSACTFEARQNGRVGAREELTAAVESLATRGVVEFSPAELIAEARALGSQYPDSTLRTMIVTYMSSTSAGGGVARQLERVGRGRYRRRANRGSQGEEPAPAERPPEPARDAPVGVHDKEWFWEGNVQAAVVSHLAANGWHIRRVANTASSEHGIDVEADRRGQRLLVEVKGYPGAVYARGTRKGSRKQTPAAAQARTYFGNALLTGLIMRSEDDTATVVIAFPDVSTFANLCRRVAAALATNRIELWLVKEDGTVVPVAPVRPASS
jgi:hypothetical protein